MSARPRPFYAKPLLWVVVTILLVTGLIYWGLAGGKNASDSSSSSQKAATVGLTYIPNVQFSAFYLAAEKGFFATPDAATAAAYGDDAAGLEVKLRHHGNDEGLFSALISGKEDAVVASGDEALQAASQGMKVQIAGLMYQRYPVEILALESSGIKRLADLKGHTIGVPGRYGSSWFGLHAALQAGGLSLDDVTVAEIGYTQNAQLVSGKVDAIVGFSNNDRVQLELAGQAVTALPLPADTPLLGAALVVRQDYAQHYPARVAALVSAMSRGMHLVVSDPQAALQATAAYDSSLDQGPSRRAAEAVLAATSELLEVPSYNEADPLPAVTVSAERAAAAWAELEKLGALGPQAGHVDPASLVWNPDQAQ